MLGSDWRPLAKVGGLGLAGLGAALFILFVGYTLGASAGYFDTEAKGYAAQYPSDTDNRVERCFAEAQPPGETKGCVEQAIQAGHESARAEHDLNAQRQMANWAWWLLIVTMAQLPFTAVGLLFLLRTIWQGQEALEHSRTAAKTADRAWVKFELEVEYGPATDSITEQFFVFSGKLLNIGKSPARQVNHWSALYFSQPAENLAREIAEIQKDPLKWRGTTIFPGDDTPIKFRTEVDEEKRIFAGMKGDSGNGSHVFLVFLVQYKTVYDETLHITAAVYRIVSKKGFLDELDFSRYHSQGELILKRHEEGTNYAD